MNHETHMKHKRLLRVSCDMVLHCFAMCMLHFFTSFYDVLRKHSNRKIASQDRISYWLGVVVSSIFHFQLIMYELILIIVTPIKMTHENTDNHDNL